MARIYVHTPNYARARFGEVTPEQSLTPNLQIANDPKPKPELSIRTR